MGLFGRGNKVVDERIVNMQNKIYKEIYLLIMVICIGSIALKYYTQGIGLNLVATEMVILISQAIYYAIRSAGMGIFSAEVEMHDRKSKTPMKMKNIWLALIIGLGFSAFFGTLSAINYADSTGEKFYFFVVTFFASMIIYVPLMLIFLSGSFFAAKKYSDDIVKKELEDEMDK
jgi:FtsH-binding integral membrane protein